MNQRHKNTILFITAMILLSTACMERADNKQAISPPLTDTTSPVKIDSIASMPEKLQVPDSPVADTCYGGTISGPEGDLVFKGEDNPIKVETKMKVVLSTSNGILRINNASGNYTLRVKEDADEVVITAVSEKDRTCRFTKKFEVREPKIYEMFDLQVPPSFPGGESALLKFIKDNLIYPELAKVNQIQGTVACSFVVKKDGRIEDITILKDIGGGCGKEAIRLIKSMPNWNPAKLNGTAVNVRFTLPIRFRIE